MFSIFTVLMSPGGRVLAANEIHVADIGTIFRVTLSELPPGVTDAAQAVPVDLSSATVNFVFLSSQKRKFVVPGVLTTDGKDGQVQYTTVAGDLDVKGRWQFQLEVAIGPGSWSSDISVFTVSPNL